MVWYMRLCLYERTIRKPVLLQVDEGGRGDRATVGTLFQRIEIAGLMDPDDCLRRTTSPQPWSSVRSRPFQALSAVESCSPCRFCLLTSPDLSVLRQFIRRNAERALRNLYDHCWDHKNSNAPWISFVLD